MLDLSRVHVDVETYCELDIRRVGAFKYTSHHSFEIVIFAYKSNDMEEVRVLNCTDPLEREEAEYIYKNSKVIYAHNATFEKLACLAEFGDSDATYVCSLVKSAYLGLPLALGQVAIALKLDMQKDKGGTALINYFSKPCKPTDANEHRTRNLPHHDPVKWASFMDYCGQDVRTEIAISEQIGNFELPDKEIDMYAMDFEINRRGVLVDVKFVKQALAIDAIFRERLMERAREITGVLNPNSAPQLMKWLNESIGADESNLDSFEVTDLKKASVSQMLELELGEQIQEVLEIRQQLSKSSVRKYKAIIEATAKDRRVRGLFQYYGANRTGRWAGRLVQMQNLPRGILNDEQIEDIREQVKSTDPEDFVDQYIGHGVGDILSSLIRSSFVPPKGSKLLVSDLSAIEARVLAWVARETWRLDVFKTHGKIYEASASQMFNVPLESVTKDLRQKGKVAELALGYQGALGALIQMGGLDMGLTEGEMLGIVKLWRLKSPNIVRFWKSVEDAVKLALRTGKRIVWHLFEFGYVPVGSGDFKVLYIKLPSGRKLNYVNPSLEGNKIKYWGLNDKKKWTKIDSYGGKFTENIVQAIARDVLVEGLLRCQDLDVILHVHDEIAIESKNPQDLELLEVAMSSPIDWADGLPLGAEGFKSSYYKK